MKKMQLEEKKKILDSISRLSEIANKKNWISHYDTDSDSLAIRKPNLSKDAQKRYITDEFAFYLNSESNLEGIFIEYFISNFVQHHKDVKAIVKNLKKKVKEEEVIELRKRETQKLVPQLEIVILNSLIRDGGFQKVR